MSPPPQLCSSVHPPPYCYGRRAFSFGYFAGLTIAEAAQVLDISEPTAKRYWTFARAWLYQAIQTDAGKE